MEGEEGVRHKDRTAIHGAVNVSSSLTSSTNINHLNIILWIKKILLLN